MISLFFPCLFIWCPGGNPVSPVHKLWFDFFDWTRTVASFTSTFRPKMKALERPSNRIGSSVEPWCGSVRTFNNWSIEFLFGNFSFCLVFKSDESESFRATLIKNNFNIRNGSKFLKVQFRKLNRQLNRF